MSLQYYLANKFKNWKPPAPEVVNRSKGVITLCWNRLGPFDFLADDLLYIIEKNNKMPKWIVVYSGGKTTRTIDNLAPRHPHKFRLKIILKANAVANLTEKAVAFYTDETSIYKMFNKLENDTDKNVDSNTKQETMYSITGNKSETCMNNENPTEIQVSTVNKSIDLYDDDAVNRDSTESEAIHNHKEKQRWIESVWSEETWTNTDTDGTSAICFSMAVRCGYLKQVQGMLEERQDLIGAINTSTGFTPLATAVRTENMNMVKFLVSFGADVNETSSTGQTPLHLAVLSGNTTVSEFLLEKGANWMRRDRNGLQIEHYAVDSYSLEMVKFILDRGGDVAVKDNNGWTPLFRAVCQKANTEIIEDLVRRGSDIDVKDRAGLELASVARLIKDKHGRTRDSILRLVDSNYPHEKALANFTRLTKKVHNVHSLLKLT